MKHSTEERKAIAEYSAAHGMIATRAEFSVGNKRITAYRKESGITEVYKQKRNKPAGLNAEWQALREAGKTCKVIAEMVGKSASLIQRRTKPPAHRAKRTAADPQFKLDVVESYHDVGRAATLRVPRFKHLNKTTINSWARELAAGGDCFNPDKARLPLSVMIFAGINNSTWIPDAARMIAA